MATIIGISGSPRCGSYNTALLRAAAQLMPDGMQRQIKKGFVRNTTNSIPGVFKNAIHWLSSPPADIQRVFGGKPVALIGASPGGFGAILSQNAWLPVLRTLGAEFGPRDGFSSPCAGCLR